MRALAACTVASNLSVMLYRSTVLFLEPPEPPATTAAGSGLSPLCISYSTGWVKKSKLLILIEHVNNANKTEKIGGTWTNTNNSYRDKKHGCRRGTSRRAVTVKTVLNVAQMFVELHLISPALGKWPSRSSSVIGNGKNRQAIWYFLLVVCLRFKYVVFVCIQ